MATDQNGTELRPGDTVTVLCRVVAVADPSNVSDVHLRTAAGAHANGAGPVEVMLAGRQVVKVVAPAPEAEKETEA